MVDTNSTALVGDGDGTSPGTISAPMGDKLDYYVSNLIILTCCISVTLQLLRLSIDLIQCATVQQKSEEKKLLETKRQNSTVSNSSSKYGSIGGGVGNDATGSSKKTSEEKKPLLGGSVASTVTDDETGDTDGDAVTASMATPFSIVHLPRISLLVHIILIIAFGICTTELLAKYIGPYLGPSMFAEYNNLVWCTCFVMVLGAMLVIRDMHRERFGFFQKFFYLISSLVLWIIYGLVTYVKFYNNNYKVELSNNDYVLLGLISLYLALTLLECMIPIVKPETMGKDVQTKGKKKLSAHALGIILKPYFWPHATSNSAYLNRFCVIMVWVCVIVAKAFTLISPLLLGWASTELAHQNYMQCAKYSCAYALTQFLGSTFNETRQLFYLKVQQAAFVQISEVVFKHVHSLSLDWHLKKKLGEVIRSMDRGIQACDTLMKYLFLWLVPSLAECLVVCIIFATWFQYTPLAISVLYFIFFYVVWTILVTLWRKKFRKAVTQTDNEWHDRCTDSLINFETVKYFTAEDYEVSRFSEAVRRFQKHSVSVQASLSFLNISQRFFMQTCLATALSLSAYGIKNRAECCTTVAGCDTMLSDCCREVSNRVCPGMEVGDFVAVLTYIITLFTPLNFLGSVYNAIVMAIIDLAKFSELLAENPDVADLPDAIQLPKTNEAESDLAVEFDNVVFRYPTQPKNKGLKGLSFKMKRGTTTAIVGPTGAGKTTVSRLLFRFYDVLDGAVKVNGVDVRAVTQKSLRQSLGVVPQVATMFNDTIKSNMLYGKRDATDEELNKAAEDAQLSKFIESLDDKWETLVGDRGLKLSGGEKQRAAIARCLLKDPPFVLLDEATSSLDTLTEKSVQEALDRLGSHRTVLVIAHRLGTIRNADNIIVLKDGVVAEQGTHDELIEMPNGVYADMWNMQLHSTSASNSRSNLTTDF